MNEQNGSPLSGFLPEVVSQDDRVLFEEAVASAVGGAYRAAYIMTWLTCAESLKRRFRELSIRDDTAQKAVAKITEAEAQQRAVDKLLLEEARKYGLIKDSEALQLEHIYAMRCVYGHPYEERPAIEALIAAARTVVDIVLSRPTKLRQGYLTEQVQLITENRAFLDDLRDPVEQYARETLPKVDDGLHFWFLRKLWDRIEKIALDPSLALFVRRGVWFTAAYLSQLPQESSGPWNVVVDLAKYPNSLTKCLAVPRLFAQVSDHAKDFIVGNLLRLGESSGEHLRMLQHLQDEGVLSERQVTRFESAVGTMELPYLAATGLSPRYFAGLIVEELKSHDWHRQNPAAAVLGSVGPDGIATLGREVQLGLGNNVLQAADGGSFGATQLLEDIADSPERWPEPFVEGILAECVVNDSDEIRFKTKRAAHAVRTLSAVSPERVPVIIDRLIGRIRAGNLKSGWGSADQRDHMLAALAQCIQEGPPYAHDFERLASTIAGLDIAPDE